MKITWRTFSPKSATHATRWSKIENDLFASAMRVRIQSQRKVGKGPMSPPARFSDLNAFGDRERVLEINAKVADGAIHLGVSE
jgi:hypothetical protein